MTDRGVIDLHARLGARHPDLRSLLAEDLPVVPDGAPVDYGFAEIGWLPVVPNPTKIVCVGLNYRDHRAETGNRPTRHPALFLRTPDSQVGHEQPLVQPRESATLDYEAEIAVVIGRGGRRIPRERAWHHVAGISCYNDGSVREFQRHTAQYTAGKKFPGTGGFGPWLTTMDELAPRLTLSCRVNGATVQSADTDGMIFPIDEIVEYASTVFTLEPGDVLVTGTPGGVGSRREPPVFLAPGDVVEVEIGGVGVLRNPVVNDQGCRG
ncbi:2-keto-4-pentenoate hydratase/2-oxohepta-3-ene-1,7-dioic acid hydratase in catechol pathway [Pseudonocardia eucalypti]|uniref:fumarylacetoacetate hydrolase family protein n=1 Tax=Pseudonocardia eucalypti TaxID=648755 RepID=UPI0018238904|nr:2-keto-4-pentenoate hydratase/2-oxohepta-3-ene-1,7-dioic acid hydratase in catechol pathway [Pseudonocardia eucalypti]